jgi:hypothetical protein
MRHQTPGGRGKRRFVNDDYLRSAKVSNHNAKFVAVIQSSIKGRELTSFAFTTNYHHQLTASRSHGQYRMLTAILRAVHTSQSGSFPALSDTGEGKLVARVPEPTVARVRAGRPVTSRPGATRPAMRHVAVISEWQWSASEAVDTVTGVIAWTQGVPAIPIEVLCRHQAAKSQKGDRKGEWKNHFSKYSG